MKFYQFLSIFVFAILCAPYGGFAQEDSLEHSQQDLQNEDFHPNFLEVNNHPEHPSLSDDLSYRVEHESDTFQSKFLNMLFLLALLIGFMILASWALKRLMKSKIIHQNTSSQIRILETRYLSPRATLYLVEIQDRTYLIGESPTSVTYLATLNAEQPQSPNTFE